MKSVLFVPTIFCVLMGFGQTEVEFEKSVDAILEVWNDNSKPGMAAGILKNGEVIYLKGFGAANLETKAPITTATKFQVDELSKQFTVLAFLLLEEQGKISMDDDVRKHIQKLPEYTKKLKLKHVLNHSSGLWDYSVLKELIGRRSNDVFTHEDALNLIAIQGELSFSPGTAFSARTSDTEITLMTEIIQKASGKSLADFAREFIFSPLKMDNTLFCDDYEMIIPNLAKSYQATGTGFKKRTLNNSNVGPTNLYTSAEDLAIWYSQFSKPKKGITSTIQKLHDLAVLDSGQTRKDSWGVLTLARDFWHKERGIPAYWQFGLLGGYGVNMFGFPDQDIFSFVLGNNNQYNGLYAMSTLEPLLKNHYKTPPVVDFSTKKTKNLSLKKLNRFEGDYWDADGGYARKVYVKNDTLRYFRVESEYESALVPLSDNTFQMVVESDDVVMFEFKELENEIHLAVTAGESDPFIYKPYTPRSYTAKDLNEFAGIFYNAALNTTYTCSLADGNLVLKHLGNGAIEFQPIKTDVFHGNRNFFHSITFSRKNNSIVGFKITAGGIDNLSFKKI